MKKTFKKLTAMLLLSASVFLLSSFTSMAEDAAGNTSVARSDEAINLTSAEYSVRKELSLSYIKTKNIYSYPSVSISYNGRSLGSSARLINGVTYVPLREFVDSLTDMTVSYDNAAKTMYVNGYGLELSVSDGAYAVYANGRVLFCFTPSVVMSDGKMYTPLSSISRALSLSLSENEAKKTASLSGTVRPLEKGATYYREDEVYWLSRIISAESRGESLIGQIAVGNVVLNRVRSKDFPNTIWGVIFDKKYGVQFSPVANGTIYASPTSTAVIAAKICLEGFSLSNDVQFFLRPSLSTSSWIPRTREYVFSIGNHDFYI